MLSNFKQTPEPIPINEEHCFNRFGVHGVEPSYIQNMGYFQ